MSVTLENVTRAVDGIPAIRDVSLTLERGTLSVLLGPTLSGKTSTMRLLAGLLIVIRISEILSQSVEVVLNRIVVDAASGLVTLVIYALQAVAIFAICSAYAARRTPLPSFTRARTHAPSHAVSLDLSRTKPS